MDHQDTHMDDQDMLDYHGEADGSPIPKLDLFLNHLEELEMLLLDAKKVPLTSQIMINRDAAMVAIQGLRDNIEDAVAEANNLLVDEARIRQDAEHQFNNRIAEANAKAKAVDIEARQTAEGIKTAAQNDADQYYNNVKKQADDLYADAQRQAKAIKDKAEREAQQMVAESTIMAEADREATRITNDAHAEAQRELLAAVENCDKMLKRAEDTAIDIANRLRNERMKYDRNR